MYLSGVCSISSERDRDRVMGLWVAGREQSGAGDGYRSEKGRPRGGASSLCPFLFLHLWRVVSPPALTPPGTDLRHPSPHTPCPRLHGALQRLLTRLGPRPSGVHSEGTASALPSGQVQDSDLCLLLLPMRPPPFSPSPASWSSPPTPPGLPQPLLHHTRPPGRLPSCSFSISLWYGRPLHPFWLPDALSGHVSWDGGVSD